MRQLLTLNDQQPAKSIGRFYSCGRGNESAGQRPVLSLQLLFTVTGRGESCAQHSLRFTAASPRAPPGEQYLPQPQNHNKIISSQPQVKRSNRFKVQEKHSGETIETKPIIDFEGRKAVAQPAPLELFTTGEHLLGTVRAELRLSGAVEQSRQLH